MTTPLRRRIDQIIFFVVLSAILISAAVFLQFINQHAVDNALGAISKQGYAIESYSVVSDCYQGLCTPQVIYVTASGHVYECAVRGREPICILR